MARRAILQMALALLAVWSSAAGAGWYLDTFSPEASMESWYRPVLQRLEERFPQYFVADPVAVVRTDEQRLYVIRQGEIQASYPVSTSRFGLGNEDGSLKTPLGVHRIQQKIGADAPVGAVFVAREPTGETTPIVTEPRRTEGDHITTRILRLEGLEQGVNRGQGIDSLERHIYIHGTDEEGLIGRPASQGCVRMTNADVMDLFDTMPEGALVVIHQGQDERPR
ncbi:L,D-transpeptidase catalytic domain [Ectothiorhodospira mobilis]|uniref:L,D-transpeptidase catalytic domain n=2 Tax=Ectothiorhodospira mobilis TaxID=195064 RepID=A0A1I4SQA2_ECTMO|nr:L,D-transpeptidase family protein [Ectothiorhodospira mobilis]MCG5536588.1 L,D-transpeptidase family protein [Ectothiorhodospira mobilis]SFM66483.1 L,D-transpeptidase catalytic domain [Ectothiorhodospira mobilis]